MIFIGIKYLYLKNGSLLIDSYAAWSPPIKSFPHADCRGGGHCKPGARCLWQTHAAFPISTIWLRLKAILCSILAYHKERNVNGSN